MSALDEQLGAGVLLCCAALLLASACLHHRAVLGLFCATLAAGLAVAAPPGAVHDPSELLMGSAVASATGAALLLLGTAVQRLLEDTPPEGRDICPAAEREANQ